MTRLEDLLPPGTEAEWSCGHVAGAVCRECHYQLARRAIELAAENEQLRETVARQRAEGAGRYWEGRWRDADAENARLRTIVSNQGNFG
jgi:hypothetical protein